MRRRILQWSATLVAMLGCMTPTSFAAGVAPTRPGAAPTTAPAPPSPRQSSAVAATPPATNASRTRAAVSSWPTTTFVRTEYVDVRDIARRFGLKPVWKTPGRTIELRAANNAVRALFEADSAETEFSGTRVILGKGVMAARKTLYVTRVDVVKTVEPILGFPRQMASLPPLPKTIVIDPGHGGWDPGKQNLPLKVDEKDATLDVAQRLRRLLEARGYRVLLTRSSDKALAPDKISDLTLRSELANRTGADLFVSIHFNAVDGAIAQRVAGTETFVMTPLSHASTDAESDRDMIRTEYPANRVDAQSTAIGYVLHQRLVKDLDSRDRGLKRARFVVLRMARCPSVLIESAYLSNTAEARKIGNPQWRQQLAESLANGIDQYRDAIAPKGR